MATTMRLGDSSGSTHGSTHEILTAAPSGSFIGIFEVFTDVSYKLPIKCFGDSSNGGGGRDGGNFPRVCGGRYGGVDGGDTAGGTAASAIAACRTASSPEESRRSGTLQKSAEDITTNKADD